MSDNVEHPSHYNVGGVETIEGIKAALGDAFLDYCRGNALKYVWRCKHKGKLVEDLRKASKYLEWAIEAAEGNCPAMPDSSSAQPLAIPEGFRELEPDEIPKPTDMHEWMGGWFFRNTDATHEYKWHSSRHIRKIETANVSETPSSLMPDPGEGYRLLSKEPTEAVIKGDEFFDDGDGWVETGNWGHGVQCSSYYRRKIEPTAWIPKVGDKVRVNSPGRIVDGLDCVIIAVENGKCTAQHRSLISNELNPEHLELIEAAQ